MSESPAKPMRYLHNITVADQKMINQFARFHKQSMELKEELKTLNRDLHNVNDALDDLLLDEDSESSAFKMGTVFVHYDHDTLVGKVEKQKEELESRITSICETNDRLNATMESLKLKLYAKFGKSINLETSDQ